MNQIIDFFITFCDRESSTLIKFSFAALAGIIIGIERELRRKQVGIKTLLCIAVGSALLTTVSIESVTKYAMLSEGNINMDPMRLAAQIVSGVGFLGAGVIMRKNNNDVVSGLTTAAIIWVVSGIGIAIGAGFYNEAFLALFFYMVGLDVVPVLIQKILRLDFNQKLILIKLTMPREYETKGILSKVKANHIKIKNLRISDEKEKKKVLEIRGYIGSKRYVSAIYDELSKIEEIDRIDIQE